MPLVVPEVSESEFIDIKNGEWATKLVGKKIGDKHDDTTFDKADLPPQHRVLGPDTPATLDYRPDRLNVHVTKDGVATHVSHY